MNPAGRSASIGHSIPAAEWKARQELACAYRLFDHFGWHELIYNHITVRVPGSEGHFLINPFGLLYREVCASNLVKIDLDGNIVGESAHPVNPAGFVVHSAIHAARHDAQAVAHVHTTAGQAVACQREGLLPLSFSALFYTDRIAYHDFEGITLERDERARLAADLGDRNVMILRNHGLLSCGPTIAHAFLDLYQLQRACEVQIAAQAGGSANLALPSRDAALNSAAQHRRALEKGIEPAMAFAAMTRWMIAKDPSFLE
jgi:ribulose-5-phosphate 4-epimerase/fuculose-1-phosphate aldolase